MESEAAAAGQTSPDRIRAILSDGKPTGPAQADQADGSLRLYAMDSVMADIVSQAAAARGAFTLVMARPGPGVSPGEPIPTSTPAEVEDLAAALAVSVTDNQPLLRAGAQHLAVVVPGGARSGRREAMEIMSSAAAQGAPLFTWASAHYPSDASTAGGLVEVASGRLDGAAAAQDTAFIGDEEAGRRRAIGAVWGGVAAAVLVGALIFGLHGGSPTTKGTGAAGTTSGSGGQASTSSGGTSSGGAPSGYASGASIGSGASGYNHTSGAGSSGSSGSSPSGSTGSSSGTTGSGGGSGSTGQQGSSGSTGGSGTVNSTGTGSGGGSGSTTTVPGLVPGVTLPTLPVTLPTLPPVTLPTLPGVGGLGGSTGTGNNNCTGLIQAVTCTIGGLLGGL